MNRFIVWGELPQTDEVIHYIPVPYLRGQMTDIQAMLLCGYDVTIERISTRGLPCA